MSYLLELLGDTKFRVTSWTCHSWDVVCWLFLLVAAGVRTVVVAGWCFDYYQLLYCFLFVASCFISCNFLLVTATFARLLFSTIMYYFLLASSCTALLCLFCCCCCWRCCYEWWTLLGGYCLLGFVVVMVVLVLALLVLVLVIVVVVVAVDMTGYCITNVIYEWSFFLCKYVDVVVLYNSTWFLYISILLYHKKIYKNGSIHFNSLENWFGFCLLGTVIVWRLLFEHIFHSRSMVKSQEMT